MNNLLATLVLGSFCCLVSTFAAEEVKPVDQNETKTGANPAVKVALQERKEWRFGELLFENKFSGARLNDLVQEENGSFTAFIDPEVTPINPSPWYAFNIHCPDKRTIALNIKLRHVSNGKPLVTTSPPWVRSLTRPGAHVPAESWSKEADRSSTTLPLDPGINLVTAFSPVPLEDMVAWQAEIKGRAIVTSAVIGSSIEGRPIEQLTICDQGMIANNYLVIIGGQHPPEITGNRGLRHFVSAVCANTGQAVAYRKRFQTIVFPMINPDGKYHGHWRTNLGGVDLNRDWDKFQQPETRAVRDYLLELGKKPGVKLFAMIDFHSVYRNMMYIEQKEATAKFSEFTKSWLGDIKEQHGREIVTEYGSTTPTAKFWFTSTFDQSAYTREFAYLDKDENIKIQAQQEADSLMKLLLGKLPANP